MPRKKKQGTPNEKFHIKIITSKYSESTQGTLKKLNAKKVKKTVNLVQIPNRANETPKKIDKKIASTGAVNKDVIDVKIENNSLLNEGKNLPKNKRKIENPEKMLVSEIVTSSEVQGAKMTQEMATEKTTDTGKNFTYFDNIYMVQRPRRTVRKPERYGDSMTK